jgi:glycosyltransferase involved in cell wall biosynthesis
MILGGAQENTLYTVQGLHQDPEYDVTLITGPAIGPEGELEDQARASGVRLLLVPEMRREIHAWRDTQTFLALTRMLRELKPHIVHTHSSKAGILGRMAAKRAGVPVIIHTIHGQAFHENLNWLTYQLFLRLERHVARYTDKIISVADAMTDQAVAAGVAPRERFVTIRSGMEVNTFLECDKLREATRRQYGFEPDQVVVGKIARIAPLKGYEYMLELCRQLSPKHPKLRFMFVGDGQLRQEIEAEAGRAGVRDRIVFAGLVPASQIPACISAMDIVVHTSLREGLARVLPQALISGKPAVSFDIDGAREVVQNGETGYLVEPRSVPGLLEAVEKLIDDPALRATMGQRGRELCARPFDKDVMVQEIGQVYRKFIPRPPSGVDPKRIATDNRDSVA